MAGFQHIINILWLLAIVPVILLFVFNSRWKKKVTRKLGDGRLVRLMMVGFSEQRHRTKITLFSLAIAILAMAMMNYQKPVQQAGGGLKGLDVIFALDVSNSMLANDVPPNRLERARLLSSKLIDTLQGNRVGIIAFAGDAYLQLPLTTDLTAARLYLHSVSTGLVPRQGTNIHDALRLANESMDPAEHQYKVVLLITDGEELDEQAMTIATRMKQSGIVILPVGIGTPNGATVPGDNGEPKRDDNGRIVISRLNEELLQNLAKETNGTYRYMGETAQTLGSIISELNNMDKKPITNSTMVNYRSYSPILVAIALILLLIELLIPARQLHTGRRQLIRKLSFARRKIAPVILLLFLGGESYAQNAKVLLHKANEAYRLQQYDEAEKLYESVLKADPSNNVAKYNLGNIAYRRQQFEDAVKRFENVNTEKEAGVKAAAGAWNNKGLSYVKQEDLDKAIASFKQSLRENPYDEEVRNNLLKALQEQQKQNEQNKPKPDSNKQKQPPPPQQQPRNKLKKKEAEEKLAALRQEEKKIRDKIKQPSTGETSEKDW